MATVPTPPRSETELWRLHDADPTGPLPLLKVRYRDEAEVPDWRAGPELPEALERAAAAGWAVYDRETGGAPDEYAIVHLRRPARGDGAMFVPERRIGDRAEAARLWVERCAARNRALRRAAEALAETAALARQLASWAHARGERALAARLQDEAADEEHQLAQVRAMLMGLPAGEPDPA